MYRRRYVALVGAGLLAGCGNDSGGEPTAASTPTGTATQTETTATAAPSTEADAGTETAVDTQGLTGPELATAELDTAATRVLEAHDVYLSYAGDSATTLLDVPPNTASFNGGRIQTICRQATERIDAGRDSAGVHQQPRIQRLGSAATWLSGAAGIQDSLGTVANYLQRTERTASGGAGLGTVASHFRSARATVGDIRSAYDELDAPRNNAFGEFDGIDGDDVDAMHRRLGREASGLETLVGLIDDVVGAAGGESETGGAIGTLQSAQESSDAGNDERAGDLAESAADGFEDVLDRTDNVDPDSLQPLVDSFGGALEALRERAVALAEDAADGGS